MMVKPAAVDEFLLYKPAKGMPLLRETCRKLSETDRCGFSSGLLGEAIDLKHGGFDLLLKDNYNGFSYWLADHMGAVKTVFEEVLAKTWAGTSRCVSSF
jgi:hypothetical protein